jgi:DNA repair exonuclease SbcCD ATPase subunit
MATVEKAREEVRKLEEERAALKAELARIDGELSAKPAATVDAEVRRLEPLTVRKMAVANLFDATENRLAEARVALEAAEERDKMNRAAAANGEADRLLAQVADLIKKAYSLAGQADDKRGEAGSLEGWQGKTDAHEALTGLRHAAEACGAKSFMEKSGRYELKWGI